MVSAWFLVSACVIMLLAYFDVMLSGVFIKENIAFFFFFKWPSCKQDLITSCTHGQVLAFPSFSSSEMKFLGLMKRGIKS